MKYSVTLLCDVTSLENTLNGLILCHKRPNNYLRYRIIREKSSKIRIPAQFSMEGAWQEHRRNDLDTMVLDFLLERVPEFVQLEVVRNEVSAKT